MNARKGERPQEAQMPRRALNTRTVMMKGGVIQGPKVRACISDGGKVDTREMAQLRQRPNTRDSP